MPDLRRLVTAAYQTVFCIMPANVDIGSDVWDIDLICTDFCTYSGLQMNLIKLKPKQK